MVEQTKAVSAELKLKWFEHTHCRQHRQIEPAPAGAEVWAADHKTSPSARDFYSCSICAPQLAVSEYDGGGLAKVAADATALADGHDPGLDVQESPTPDEKMSIGQHYYCPEAAESTEELNESSQLNQHRPSVGPDLMPHKRPAPNP